MCVYSKVTRINILMMMKIIMLHYYYYDVVQIYMYTFFSLLQMTFQRVHSISYFSSSLCHIILLWCVNTETWNDVITSSLSSRFNIIVFLFFHLLFSVYNVLMFDIAYFRIHIESIDWCVVLRFVKFHLN